MATVELAITASTKDAEKSIKSFVSSASGMLTGLKALGAAAIGYIGGRALIGAVSEFVTAAAGAQDEINNLNLSLASTGEYSAEASKEFRDFANQIQQTTRIAGGTVLQNVALAKSFGLTNDQAKLATQAAIELSAATGKDLGTSIEAVSKTFVGSSGQLGKYNLSVRSLTSEQLRAGEAARLLIAQYGGTAQGQVATFSGAMQQLENNMASLRESIGSIIVENPAVVAAIQTVSEMFGTMNDAVNDNKGTLSDFLTEGIRELVRALPTAVKAVGSVMKAYYFLKFATYDVTQSVIDLISSFYKLPGVKKVVNELTMAFERLYKWATGESLLGILPGEDEIDIVEELTDQLDYMSDSLEEAKTKAVIDFDKTETNLQSVIQLSTEFGTKFEENLKKNKTASDDLAKGLNDAKGGAKELKIELEKITIGGLGDNLVKAFDSLKNGMKMLFTEPIKALEAAYDGIVNLFKEGSEEVSEELVKDAGNAFAQILTDGKKAAVSAGAMIIAALGDAIVPGLGQFLGPIAQAAAQDPEAIREQVRMFAQGLAEAVPAIVEGLVAAADEIVFALIDSLITRGGLVRIVEALIMLIPRVAWAMAESFFEALKLMGPAITEGLRKAFQSAFDYISMERLATFFTNLRIEKPTWVQALEDAVHMKTPWYVLAFQEAVNRLLSWDPFGTGGGKGSSATEKVKDFLGMASGGVVPPGYPNDTYGASLSSGELVVPPRSAGNLFEMIDDISSGNGAAGDDTTNNLLMQILAALSAPVTVDAKAVVHEKAFADIMLNLSRRSARTAA